MTTSNPTPINLLEPINLHDEIQFASLQHQRLLCGWSHSTSILEAWRAAIDARTQAMFWVVPPSTSHLPAHLRYAGHVGMLRKTFPNENGIDNPLPELEVMNIGNLFILPEHRGGGLARKAVRAIEDMAKVEPYGWPGCKAMTLDTLAKRYVEDDELRGMAASAHVRFGAVLPEKGRSNEDWYARMGYVKWKEVPLYPAVDDDGGEFMFLASFMWKPLE